MTAQEARSHEFRPRRQVLAAWSECDTSAGVRVIVWGRVGGRLGVGAFQSVQAWERRVCVCVRQPKSLSLDRKSVV